MIRQATEADLPALLEMGRKFHAASPWRVIPFSDERFAQSVRAQLAGAGTYLVNEALTGMIGMVSGPVYFAENVTVAQETAWWCEDPRDALKLLQAAEEWARGVGASHVCMVRLEGVTERLGPFYERRGYAPTEHYYLKGL